MCLLVEEYGSAQLGSTIQNTIKAVAIGTEVMVPLNFGRDQRYRRDLLQGIGKVSGERTPRGLPLGACNFLKAMRPGLLLDSHSLKFI